MRGLNEEINGITVFGNITITDEKMKKSVEAIPFIVKSKTKENNILYLNS